MSRLFDNSDVFDSSPNVDTTIIFAHPQYKRNALESADGRQKYQTPGGNSSPHGEAQRRQILSHNDAAPCFKGKRRQSNHRMHQNGFLRVQIGNQWAILIKIIIIK